MRKGLGYILMITILCSCSDATNISLNLGKQKITEASIEYAITFPYVDDDGLMTSFLPDKMMMHIKDNKYSTKIKTYGGVFKSANIVDTKKRKFTQMLKIFKKKVTSDYTEDDMDNFLGEFPDFTILPSIEIDTIAGFACQKAVAVFHDLTTPDITIFHTNEFEIKEPNWCNPFSEIKGVMLAYSIEQFDARACLTATNVNIEKVAANDLNKDEGYKEVTYDMMKIEFEQIMDSFDI